VLGVRRAAVAAAAFALVALVAGGCGDRSTLDVTFDDGGVEGSLPPGCGDGLCNGTETCTTCSADCGVCSTCGDHVCEATESCTSCPQDCGVCATCGDGYCNGDETCENCAADCGTCQSCGDGKCQAPVEDCYTCPADCGKCMGCGDGTCSASETCASCPQDCGPCAVCGNGKCESPYETCVNCPQDCGQCTTISCFEILTCAFGCIDLSSNPPAFSLTCVGDCVARGCASAGYFADQAVDCFIANIGSCNPVSFNCLTSKCSGPVNACLGSTCPAGM
jgi:hypothetical protein